jgi:hypothetical protein
VKAFLWAFGAAIAASVLWIVVQVAFGFEGIAVSGSGGLGAVSVGLSEALIEAGGLAFVIVFVWRLRRTRRRAK